MIVGWGLDSYSMDMGPREIKCEGKAYKILFGFDNKNNSEKVMVNDLNIYPKKSYISSAQDILNNPYVARIITAIVIPIVANYIFNYLFTDKEEQQVNKALRQQAIEESKVQLHLQGQQLEENDIILKIKRRENCEKDMQFILKAMQHVSKEQQEELQEKLNKRIQQCVQKLNNLKEKSVTV